MTSDQENQLLCEWLGWKRITERGPAFWQASYGLVEDTPTFLDGASMLWLLEAMARRGLAPVVSKRRGDDDWIAGHLSCGTGVLGSSAPAAVRAAALSYAETRAAETKGECL